MNMIQSKRKKSTAQYSNYTIFHPNTFEHFLQWYPSLNSSFPNSSKLFASWIYYSGFGTQLPERNCKIFHGYWGTKNRFGKYQAQPSQRQDWCFLNRLQGVSHRLGNAVPQWDWVGRLARAKPFGRLGEAVWLGQSPGEDCSPHRWGPAVLTVTVKR